MSTLKYKFLKKGKVEDENEEYTCVICNITTMSETKHNKTESHKVKFLEQERQEAEDTEHYYSSFKIKNKTKKC